MPTFFLVAVGIISLGYTKLENCLLIVKKRVNFQSPFLSYYYNFKKDFKLSRRRDDLRQSLYLGKIEWMMVRPSIKCKTVRLVGPKYGESEKLGTCAFRRQ